MQIEMQMRAQNGQGLAPMRLGKRNCRVPPTTHWPLRRAFSDLPKDLEGDLDLEGASDWL